MLRRLSIMVSNAARRLVEKLPGRARSRAVVSAILDRDRAATRRKAVARMDALRATLPAVETDEIVAWIREERDGRAVPPRPS